jgi:hypothetical protein
VRTPLDLLRGHVIDACILTPTQLDESSQDLLRIELYHSTIDLTVFGPRSRDELSPRGVRYEDLLDDGHHFSLKLFGFLPLSCRQASRSWFQMMHPPAERQDPPSVDGPASSLKVAFLTPEMRRTITTPFLVDSSQPRCYRESLVILKENAQQPRFLELLDAIQPVFSPSAGGGVDDPIGDASAPQFRCRLSQRNGGARGVPGGAKKQGATVLSVLAVTVHRWVHLGSSELKLNDR